MKTKQILVKNKDLKTKSLSDVTSDDPQIGFLFGSVECLQDSEFFERLKNANPKIQWVGCSTAGEVSQHGVTDGTTVLTTLKFESPKSNFKVATDKISSVDDSYEAGKRLAEQLKSPDLKSVILISPGVNVNGSMLVRGLNDVLGKNVAITGGLAGDNGKFEKTWTVAPSGISANGLVGVGFYGESIAFQHGCMGGWDAFGKVRNVTKSESNVLFELDGKPALDIYKEYLGAHANELPASGLMFPFAMLRDKQTNTGLIRTILGIDDQAGSLTMAGNIEQGTQVRLMHANTDGLVTGARAAAESALQDGRSENSFALIISCVGRKLVMGTNVDEEIETIADLFGTSCALAGFYSYGEVSPYLNGGGCELHNQTMTISYIYETQ